MAEGLITGVPQHDESESHAEVCQFLEARGGPGKEQVERLEVLRGPGGGPWRLGGPFPMLVDHATMPSDAEESHHDDLQAECLQEQPNLLKAPFWISIGKRSGFRRLHRRNGGGTVPAQCAQVEWVLKAKAGMFDAVRKKCKAVETQEVSSSSGSTSSEDESTEAQRGFGPPPGLEHGGDSF